MRVFNKTKDGGKDSTVDAYFLFEFKNLFSVALLKFNKGSRTNYHSHAFNALTWFISGDMVEECVDGTKHKYTRTLKPKITLKSKYHKVYANKTSWCFTIRGSWDKTWKEYNKETKNEIVLTNGRNIVSKKFVEY